MVDVYWVWCLVEEYQLVLVFFGLVEFGEYCLFVGFYQFLVVEVELVGVDCFLD